MPGAGMEHGEDPYDTVRREVEEETGYLIEVVGLLGVGAVGGTMHGTHAGTRAAGGAVVGHRGGAVRGTRAGGTADRRGVRGTFREGLPTARTRGGAAVRPAAPPLPA